MMHERAKPGFTYRVEHIRDGVVISDDTTHNLIPDVGMNHMLDVTLKGGTAYTSWYIGIYEGNYTPQSTDTLSTIVTNSTESTAYAETTREVVTLGTIASGAVDNTASKAEFTMNATKTIYGGFVASNSVKSSTTGMLISAVKFTASKSVVSGDILRVTASFDLTSA